MKILPAPADFKNWAQCIPTDGDLLFFKSRPELVLSLTALEARDQAATFWTLNSRSWYGYSLSRASHCVWWPKGKIENLPLRQRRQLAKEQMALGVPTLIKATRLPKQLQKDTLHGHIWLTSQALSRLNASEKISAMQAWFEQNEVHSYESQSLGELPLVASRELKRISYRKRLNSYAKFSGPNCFAATAGAASLNAEIAEQWLHWEPFARFITGLGFEKIHGKKPERGDILVFLRKGKAIHAAYYLGDGLYFEKPGQDFYEPYRVEYFSRWHAEWPEAKLVIWRK